MSYDQIPLELRVLRQWLCWKFEDIGAAKPTKVPYQINGQLANVNEPSTWCNYEDAVKHSSDYSGIGFVFSDNDGFSFIDLDDTNGDTLAYDRQIKIYREFDSWSEVSPSGRGLHIIVKGHVPSGRRRNFIEVYSSQRYATFTGNVYNDKPIKDCQDKLLQLWEQMGSGGIATNLYKGDDKETFNDKEIIEQATSAINGEKFKDIFEGRWQNYETSQSEADIALINIIAFYTKNRNQIRRIFYASELGKRKKAKRKDYVEWMINKSFDRELPPIDFDGFKIALEQKINPTSDNGSSPVKEHGGSTPPVGTNSISLPPGLLGEIAQFIYAAAPRPVPEIALAAAIGLMAGITGRAYNISGTGLNQYVLLLGMTGVGKEAAASGIDRLMNTIRFQVPTSTGFIGPSEIASGQALVKHMNKTSQCFVSILGEFGLRLETMSSPSANAAEKTLKRVLLDLYNKSGHGQVFRPSIFADADKNISVTEAPAFSILGESTPERFYGALNEDMISEGLLPRFLLIEYNGARPALSDNHLSVMPSMPLIERFASLVANVEQIMHGKRVINVAQSTEALEITARFDKYADAQINSTHKEVIRQLWNRAHIKILKLAALIAVGVNMSDPIIIPEYVEWAKDIVQNDIRALSHKFEQGLIGTNTAEIKQQVEVIRMIKEYIVKDWEYCSKYCQGKNMATLHHAKVIPYGYLNKRLSAVSCFKNDRGGATIALKRALQILIDSDKVREVNKGELSTKYGTSQRAFIVSDVSLLD
jgi:NrS-1  polymerase HBD domain